MQRFFKNNFPVEDIAGICKVQNTSEAGNLNLNGNLVNSTGAKISFVEKGYSRSVSISSTNDLSTALFTITGKQNGIVVTETIAGPNNKTIYGEVVFDEINSVSVDGSVADVSIGTGCYGFILLNVNLDNGFIDYSLSVSIPDKKFKTTIYNTLDNIINNGSSFNELIAPTNPGISNLNVVKADNNEDLYVMPRGDIMPCSSILIEIEGDDKGATSDHRLGVIFIQI